MRLPEHLCATPLTLTYGLFCTKQTWLGSAVLSFLLILMSGSSSLYFLVDEKELTPVFSREHSHTYPCYTFILGASS